MVSKKGLLKVNKVLFGEKGIRNSLKISDEQIRYIIEQYKDNDTYIGMHNTIFNNYDSFFEIGLRNYTSLDKKTNDLTNTIAYSDILSVLMAYPSGGIDNENMCIVLKIPKTVLEHKRGILENLKDDTYGVPPQFIRAAFLDGKVIENPYYDKDYYSEESEMCDEDNNCVEGDKNLNIQVFNEEYYGKVGIIQKIKDLLGNLGRKRNLLEAPKEEQENNHTSNLKEKFRKDIHVKEEDLIPKEERCTQSEEKKVQEGNEPGE